MHSRRPAPRPLIVAALLLGLPALALDKQGSAHGGKVDGEDTGFHVSGALMAGVSLDNPSYAARPDNSGLALMRYAGHLDVDLLGRLLSLPLDVNLFSDRLRPGAAAFRPSELDVIAGLTSTVRAGPGALELGARVENDRPVDQGSFQQTYGDVRARYLLSAAELAPAVRSALAGGDVSGWLTLGWFAFNPSYAARPDNSGLALMRYAGHVQVSGWNGLLALGLDATFFSDRQAAAPLRPSELDLTPELILHTAPFELHLAYERDMPLDRAGRTQSVLYALGVWSFDVVQQPPAHAS